MQKVGDVTMGILKITAVCGLDLNLLPRKTEAIGVWRGPGATSAKQGINETEHLISLSSIACGGRHIRVVCDYVHLGTNAMNFEEHSLELVRKAGRLRVDVRTSKISVFSKPMVVDRKFLLLRSYLLNSTSHNGGCWKDASKTSQKKPSGALMYAYRAATGQLWSSTSQNNATDAQLIKYYKLPDLHGTLVNRLTLFVRLVVKAHP